MTHRRGLQARYQSLCPPLAYQRLAGGWPGAIQSPSHTAGERGGQMSCAPAQPTCRPAATNPQPHASPAFALCLCPRPPPLPLPSPLPRMLISMPAAPSARRRCHCCGGRRRRPGRLRCRLRWCHRRRRLSGLPPVRTPGRPPRCLHRVSCRAAPRPAAGSPAVASGI